VVDGTDQPAYGGTLLSVSAEAPDTRIVERKKDGRLLIRATWKKQTLAGCVTLWRRQQRARAWPTISHQKNLSEPRRQGARDRIEQRRVPELRLAGRGSC